MADALVIAHVGSPCLWESTRDQYLKRSHSSYLKVIIYAVLYLKLSRAWMSVGVNKENKAQRLSDILNYDRSRKKGRCVILFDKLNFF
uniref:Uncharacterized protein n=1 Tax=Nelumbo nucifera TaxID=4432 RepID=A0A822Z9U5_NELNU|nr:TPA_asm: hypothetical protein HUJ06_014492 [Nelumbo nucifera]